MAGSQMYNIAGRQIASHHLAVGWLGFLFGGIALAVGSRGKTQPATPKIEASSNEEVDFIKQFIEKAEEEQKKAGGH